jgi:hypothetical protein
MQVMVQLVLIQIITGILVIIMIITKVSLLCYEVMEQRLFNLETAIHGG